MSSRPATRRRPRGRHTSLIGDALDDLDPVDRELDAWPPPRLTDSGARVYIRGEEPGAGSDTMVLGGAGLFRSPPPGPGPAPGIGLNRPVPRRPWYRQRWRMLAVTAGLTVIAVAGFLGVPPLLTALGIGPQTGCRLCQFPIPSSAAIGPSAGASPATSAAAPRPSRPDRTTTAPATPPAAAAPPPAASTAPPALTVSYTAIPSGGGFTGQVTVVNRGTSAVSGWRMVVALPGDTVLAVQNAEFTDDNDVLFMRPAPYDLSVAPGSSVTVSIYASGPDSTPAVCSFNDVGCQ
jgi:hypothetical protein